MAHAYLHSMPKCNNDPFHLFSMMTKYTVVLLLLTASLSGCGVLAAPCRMTSAVIKIVPVVGHAAALPTDACAAVIDP
jgi:hypothetical protein